MGKSLKSVDPAALTPEFLERAAVVIAAMDTWADNVVDAWLGRRDGRFTWHVPDFRYYLDIRVEGRSITNGGECLVTRAKDGFVALVNGKQFRVLSWKTEVQLLQGALARRDVPGFVVPPPHPCQFVDAETLDQWYTGARVWHAMNARELALRYTAIAADLVDAFLDGRSAVYRDGYYTAEADGEGILVAAEWIVARPSEQPDTALVSARRYRPASFTNLLRVAVRSILEERGVRIRDVRPKPQTYTTYWDLVVAWKATELKLA